MDLKDIQRHIDQVMHEQNNRSIPEFEGYSPAEMHRILHFTFAKDCPIQLQKITDAEYKKIPMFNQIKYLTDIIEKDGEIKLTKKGFLPRKVVLDLYQQGYMKDRYTEMGISKLYKETDSTTVSIARILTELAGLVKKRNGKLSLTKSSKKILENNEEFLRQIFLTFARRFNWAYLDRYGENHIGQLGYGFSLILLSKYGQKKRPDSFYAEKYFQAFPQFLESNEPTYSTLEQYSINCYTLRTFERFLKYFGLIEITEIGEWQEKNHQIQKTNIFDKLFKVHPHKSAKPPNNDS